MIISYIVGAKSPGAELFGEGIPSVFDIQSLIEAAWDRGYNPQGRTETGGIKGTRKFIGTPEAQALFRSLKISAPVQAFRDTEDGLAARKLLLAIERYFGAAWNGGDEAKVRTTSLPPIYLQHQGHSLTVVGVERQNDDRLQLLVFDPSSRDSEAVKRFVGRQVRRGMPGANELLEPYRRGMKYLSKRKEFEILCLS
ncbi:zinc finger-containing ubiquitin peptidase 1 [Purpureocillium lavendulum]|uniref:Zinc finger-containing ubiquitin peptidase 1 n=1 Tax=Purpureocillium lavendulum TaxID=1247861 RepID=A0AB34FH42_9HYPO|nr:zinc finger-containing ubiquitin peptidase 1 [Purpureocillium lavendulum]